MMGPREEVPFAEYMEVKRELEKYKQALAELKEDAEERADWLGQDGSDARSTLQFVEEVEQKVKGSGKWVTV